MQFRFWVDQKYQLQAVEAVIDLFEGQGMIGLEFGHLLTRM